MARLVSKLFTSSGSWVCPPGVRYVFAYGVGGGGGGGGGAGGTTGTTSAQNPGGGAGGGGALAQLYVVAVTPGKSYAVNIGPGGAGGTAGPYVASAGAGANAGNGQNGTDTTLVDTAASTQVAKWLGAVGGEGGNYNVSPTFSFLGSIARGGMPTRNQSADQANTNGLSDARALLPGQGYFFGSMPGAGGYGRDNGLYPLPACPGNWAATGPNQVGSGRSTVGAGGAQNADSGSYGTGGSGGGGGGSSWCTADGYAGFGGVGGIAGSAGGAGAGTVGSAGAFGGGGGGGGAGGCSNTAGQGSPGRVGGNGGNGALLLAWVE